MKQLSVQFVVDEPMGLDLIAIQPGSDVALTVQLEAVSEGVLVSGVASGSAHGECSRCLVEFDTDIAVTFRDLYAYPGSTTDETTDDDEVPRIDDDLIDLSELVRDEITLALPLAPLCQDACPGLCQECGIALAGTEQGHSHEILDGRWAALATKFPGVTDREDRAT